MKIREYDDADLAALRRMHASQGFAYPFPDLRDPIFISKLVLEDNAGRPAMASLARLTCEIYLLVDRDAKRDGKVADATSPRERYAQLLALHDAGERDLIARGLNDAHAWLPPQVANAFGRRLSQLGWFREPWPSFSRGTGTKTPGT